MVGKTRRRGAKFSVGLEGRKELLITMKVVKELKGVEKVAALKFRRL